MRRVVRFGTVLGFAALSAIALPRNAAACRGHTWHQSIFFDAVPQAKPFKKDTWPYIDLATATILRVTVLSTIYEKSWLVVGKARVHEVIQGQVDGPDLTIRVAESSCGPVIGAGNQGIVIGTMTRTPTGDVELAPISEGMGARQARLKAESEGK